MTEAWNAAVRALEESERLRRQQCAELETLRVRALAAEAKAEVAATNAQEAQDHLNRVLDSTFWRATAPLRNVADMIRRIASNRLGVHGRVEAPPAVPEVISPETVETVDPYLAWQQRFDTPGATGLAYLESTADNVPSVTIVVRVSPATLEFARDTIQGLRRCIGITWAAIAVFEPGCPSETVEALRQDLATDSRFVTPEEMASAKTEMVLLVESGVVPRPHGLRTLVEELTRQPRKRLAYADEDRLGPGGTPARPWLKPEFDPLLLEQDMLLGRMVLLRSAHGEVRTLLQTLADPTNAPGSSVAAVALSLGERGVLHVPHVLFQDIMPRQPVALALPPLPTNLPFVSILIPTRNGWNLLGPCLESLATTDWPADRLEIIVVDNGTTDPTTLSELAAAEGASLIRVLPDPSPFNYARLNNTGARAARGDLLVLLNNDTKVIDPVWLRKLAAFAMRTGAGAVGPKLLYGDDTVQHGGVVAGIRGVAAHAHLHVARDDGGYADLANHTHQVAAVTGACLAVSREAWDACGGMDESFPVAFNDLVFCLDLHLLGRRNVYLAEPPLYHLESKTRGHDDTPEKARIAHEDALHALRRHPEFLRNDPCYSPNLSLESCYELAVPPRRRPSWRERRSSIRVMILSSTFAHGHPITVVIARQLRALLERGHEVILGGVHGGSDCLDKDCPRLDVGDPRSAAILAMDHDVDVIVAHTPPYFSTVLWTGAFPPILAFDHGEAVPPVPTQAEGQARIERDFALTKCTRVFALSEAIAANCRVPLAGVIAAGNTHLGCWRPAMEARRAAARQQRGWQQHHVILTVCRLHDTDGSSKGVDEYVRLHDRMMRFDRALAERAVFVLCAIGDPGVISSAHNSTLQVITNPSDGELLDLYAAADQYVSFSDTPHHDFGIGEALAMGLPVVASDTPGHRSFGVPVATDVAEALASVRDQAHLPAPRSARVWSWDEPLRLFVSEIETLATSAIGHGGRETEEAA